eukprot:scaffold3083_cov440-Prasinococcus_capsulatus_cf.AAC.1
MIEEAGAIARTGPARNAMHAVWLEKRPDRDREDSSSCSATLVAWGRATWPCCASRTYISEWWQSCAVGSRSSTRLARSAEQSAPVQGLALMCMRGAFRAPEHRE